MFRGPEKLFSFTSDQGVIFIPEDANHFRLIKLNHQKIDEETGDSKLN
jgi:hypothetical protein